MKKRKIKMQTIFICIILLINLWLAIFSIIIIKQTNEIKTNYKDIEFDAKTMEEVDSLKQYKKPIIVVFGADYCPTCVNYKPCIKEIYEKYKNKIIIKYIDTVENEAIRKEYNIEIIPSTIIYDAKGEIYKPSENLNVNENIEEVKERKYKSDDIIIKTGESLGLNNKFEYGQDKNGRIVYTKYVGLIDLIQLEQIIEELLQQ